MRQKLEQIRCHACSEPGNLIILQGPFRRSLNRLNISSGYKVTGFFRELFIQSQNLPKYAVNRQPFKSAPVILT